MNKIDLHMHTTCSDGKFTPKEIIDEAAKNNVIIISISDHDTTQAYTEQLFEYAKMHNIRLIPAVEISTQYGKAGIHVLGYNFDLNNEGFKDKLKQIRHFRHDYLHDVSKLLMWMICLASAAKISFSLRSA